MDSEVDQVKAVGKATKILEKLKESNGVGVTELARQLDMPKSTTCNYLKTLEANNLVVRRDGKYRLGLKFLDFGGYARNQRRFYEAGRDEIRNLAEETGELANLLVEEHGRGVYIHQAEGEKTVPVDTWIGKRIHMTTTSLGKAILAHYPDERVEEIIDTQGLPNQTENSITDRGEFFSELERVRKRDVAFDDEERLEGIRCVAAPVLGGDGNVLGAISVAGPTHRLKHDLYEEELPERVLQAANVIELRAMYS